MLQKNAKLILLTRNKEDNRQLVKQLSYTERKNKFTFLECNLINYELIGCDYSLLSQYNYCVITSKFAAAHFPEHSLINRAKNILVIGSQSAKLLQQKGHNISFIAQNAKRLRAELEKNNYRKANIIYLSANNITLEMPNFIERVIFYKTNYKTKLNDSEINYFQQRPDYILVYSENSAKALLQLILENKLLSATAKSVILAISEKVARIFRAYFAHVKSFNGESRNMTLFLQKIDNL